MQPRKAEWLHIFNELLEKDFPTAAAGLWLDVLNQKLYWVDPPKRPIANPQSAEGLTESVDEALAAAGEFLGQAAAKLTQIALDHQSDKWSMGVAALQQIRKGCVDVLRKRKGSCATERARTVAEALGDPSGNVLKNDLTDAQFAQFRNNLEAATTSAGHR